MRNQSPHPPVSPFSAIYPFLKNVREPHCSSLLPCSPPLHSTVTCILFTIAAAAALATRLLPSSITHTPTHPLLIVAAVVLQMVEKETSPFGIPTTATIAFTHISVICSCLQGSLPGRQADDCKVPRKGSEGATLLVAEAKSTEPRLVRKASVPQSPSLPAQWTWSPGKKHFPIPASLV